MDKEKLKRYRYIVHPELTYLRRFQSKYPQDITSVYSNITQGVQMFRNPEVCGEFVSMNFDKNNCAMLKYLEQKYSNLKLYNGERNFPAEGIPLYIIKYPALYDGENCSDDYMPLPYFEKFATTEMCKTLVKDIPPVTFENEFRCHPNLVYGVYSKDFGGLIRNPAWTPVVNPKGYTFSNKSYRAICTHGESQIIAAHTTRLKDAADTLKFEDERLDGGIYYQDNHKLDNLLDRYYDLFKEDMPKEKTSLNESLLYSSFTNNWDITNGLTPGNYKKNERDFI